jgi:hypothetical protein
MQFTPKQRAELVAKYAPKNFNTPESPFLSPEAFPSNKCAMQHTAQHAIRGTDSVLLSAGTPDLVGSVGSSNLERVPCTQAKA